MAVAIAQVKAEQAALADRRWATLAVAAWSAVILGIIVQVCLKPVSHTVFPMYAGPARAFWHGGRIYDVLWPDEYRYSPLFAVAISPFAYLPKLWGNLLWKLVNIGCFLLGLWTWWKYARREKLQLREISVMALLVLAGALQSAYNGNADLLTVGAILMAMAAAARGLQSRAGILLGAATLVKVFPAALTALIAVACTASVLGPFLAALAAGLAIPMVIRPGLGYAYTWQWFQKLVWRTNHHQRRYDSIDQLFRVYAHPLSPHWANGLAVAGGAAALVLCWTYARRSERREALTFTLAAFSAWVVLFLPTMEAATVVFLAPSLAVAMLDAYRRRSYGWLGALAVTWWLCGLALTDFVGGKARVFVESHGAVPAGGLLFACYVVAEWRRARTARQRHGPKTGEESRVATVETGAMC